MNVRVKHACHYQNIIFRISILVESRQSSRNTPKIRVFMSTMSKKHYRNTEKFLRMDSKSRTYTVKPVVIAILS